MFLIDAEVHRGYRAKSEQTFPKFHLIFLSFCKHLFSVIIFPKYINFVSVSKNLLFVFMEWLCLILLMRH